MNFYKILNSNIDDTQSVLKKRYYKLCKKYHPDKNKKNSDEKIKKINLAYEVLGDPDKRKQYNKYLLKKDKSKCDYLNMLYILYKTIFNDTLKFLIEQAIINYLNINQTIKINFYDFYIGSKQKINLYIKNFDNNEENEINLLFNLDKLNFIFKNKGDVFKTFKGNVNITVIIDYGPYNQFQIINNKLFYLVVNNNKEIELPTGDILDINNLKWNNSQYGRIATIDNYGLLQNNVREYLTLCKSL